LKLCVAGLAMTVEKAENESQGHKDPTQPDGSFGENIGCLSAKNRVGKVSAKGSTEAFGSGLLHEDKEGQKNTNQEVDS
jgi:hypothetical protein